MTEYVRIQFLRPDASLPSHYVPELAHTTQHKQKASPECLFCYMGLPRRPARPAKRAQKR